MTDPILSAIADTTRRVSAARARLTEDADVLSVLAADLSSSRLRSFLATASRLFAKAALLIGMSDTASRAAIVATEAVAESGRNGFQVLAENEDTALMKAQLGRISAVFNDALCALRTGSVYTNQVADYSTLNGSSNCSSTGGGEPPSIHRNENVMEKIFATDTTESPVRVSEDALRQIGAMRADVLSMVDSTDIVRGLYAMGQGIVVPT